MINSDNLILEDIKININLENVKSTYRLPHFMGDDILKYCMEIDNVYSLDFKKKKSLLTKWVQDFVKNMLPSDLHTNNKNKTITFFIYNELKYKLLNFHSRPKQSTFDID